MKIVLSPEIPVYTGRARGRQDRARFKLDDLDTSGSRIEVIVPDDVYAMTSSYFLELFGKSIRSLGREKFSLTYQILAPDHVLNKIDDWVSRALREKKGVFGEDLS